MRKKARTIIAIATGYCRIVHASTTIRSSPMRVPIPCAISGPASMTMLATPVSSPITSTDAI